jgi:F-type H+-transporting ATPase subunit epsilon
MALELVVVTPEGEALSEVVDQVVLPGEAGDFGVLESHERFLTPLSPGPMEVQSGGSSQWAALSSGFAEVDGSRVVVLVDSCSLASEIDRSAVEAERDEAQLTFDRLPDTAENAGERARLNARVAHAEVELDVAGR